MRKIVVTEFISLDGIIEDPGGSENYKYGGWTFAYWNDEIGKFKFSELKAADSHLLGRITYEGFAKAWPTMEGTGDFGVRMNTYPKYVISKSLKKADWQNSTIIRDNVATELKKIKKQKGKNILVAGSATLINSLIPHDLIDEYVLLVYPVALGSGKRLFHDDAFVTLKLVETKPMGDNGVMLMRYVPENKTKEKILKISRTAGSRRTSGKAN